MKVKEFAQIAIKNGYNSSHCDGWEWIKNNLQELDYIFQTEEYKQQQGYKYKCTPFIYGKEDLLELEKNALDTAWYLNNDREHQAKKEAYKTKMLSENWLELTEDIVKTAFNGKKKLQVSGISENDIFSSKVEETFKPYVDSKGDCYLMKPKARNRGFSIYRLKNAFCKVV